MDKTLVKQYADDAERRIREVHIGCFEGHDKPLFLISEEYPGIWLEHVYDSIFYAKSHPEYLEIARNTVRLFIAHQTPQGQLPCYVWDHARKGGDPAKLVGYGQTQEVVSFAKLCLMLWEMQPDDAFLGEIYTASAKWEAWLRRCRMTTGRGLVEMFVGFDTGHDNSERVDHMYYSGNRMENGEIVGADCPPEPGDTAPILAVDMNCNLYATERALAKMAKLLGKAEDALLYETRAAEVKGALFALCFDKEDCFFYDVDRFGRKRKIKSSAILHLFMEGVLDKNADRDLIDGIHRRYLRNPKEFWCRYPYPSVSLSEPSRERHTMINSWGYYSQALIALRCSMWMDDYGFSEDYDHICERWVEAVTDNYPHYRFGQEIVPETGVMSPCSDYYSSCMIFYLYAAKRIGVIG